MKRKVLMKTMKQRGISCRAMARKCGIFLPFLVLKLLGIWELRMWEICEISNCLHLSREDTDFIFFDEKVS